jgi:hypothetical protein
VLEVRLEVAGDRAGRPGGRQDQASIRARSATVLRMHPPLGLPQCWRALRMRLLDERSPQPRRPPVANSYPRKRNRTKRRYSPQAGRLREPSPARVVPGACSWYRLRPTSVSPQADTNLYIRRPSPDVQCRGPPWCRRGTHARVKGRPQADRAATRSALDAPLDTRSPCCLSHQQRMVPHNLRGGRHGPRAVLGADRGRQDGNRW